MISNSSEIALTNNTVSVGRKSVCISRIKDIEKYTSSIRKQKRIGVHQYEYGSSLKFDFPQMSVIFSISRKRLE